MAKLMVVIQTKSEHISTATERVRVIYCDRVNNQRDL